MKRRFALLCCLVLPLSVLVSSRVASAADSEEPVVVVDVRPSAAELDAARLDALIEKELHAHAVAPEDARAASARGTFTVEMDRATGKLTVTYATRATPLTRSVPLPADVDAARAAVVSLAGNLGRDEAGELAAQLRKQKASEEPKPAAASARPAPAPKASTSTTESDTASISGTLDYHAIEERRSRRAIGLTVTGLGVVALVTGAALDSQSGTNHPAGAVSSLSPLLIAYGVGSMLFEPTPYADLARAARNAPTDATEQAWAGAAKSEHTTRVASGIGGLVVSAAAIGVGTVIAVDTRWEMSSTARQQWATSLLTLGAVDAVLSTYFLATDGPVEKGLRAWDAGTGRAAGPQAASLHFGLSPARGGAMGGVAGSF